MIRCMHWQILSLLSKNLHATTDSLSIKIKQTLTSLINHLILKKYLTIDDNSENG